MNSAAADLKATMGKAFDLVCPAAHAKRLEEQGHLPPGTAAQVSWKGEIAALLTDEDLEVAGVTIEQVADAIVFMTATAAEVEPCMVGGRYGEIYVPAKPGYFLRALGYARGPAGDH